MLNGGGVCDLAAQGVAPLAQTTAVFLAGLPLGEERIDLRWICRLDLVVALEAVLLVELGVLADVFYVNVWSRRYRGPLLLLVSSFVMAIRTGTRAGAGAGAGATARARIGVKSRG